MNQIFSGLTALLLLMVPNLRADVQFWDADGNLGNNDCSTGAGLGGSGPWDTTSLLWTTNGCYSEDAPVAWSDYNDAVFWGSAGTLTLAEPHAAASITFKSSGFTITGSTLTVGVTNTACFTNMSANGTIASILAGTNGYSKYGPATLILNNAANSIRGPINVYQGTLRINTYQALSANQAGQTVTVDGGTLRNEDNTVGGTFLSRNVALYVGTNNGTISLNGNGGVLLYSNNILGVVPGQGILTKAGVGEFRNYGPNGAHNTFGKLVIAGGYFTAGQAGYAGYADTFCRIPDEVTDDAITIKNGAELRLSGGANVTLDAKQGITIGDGGGQIAVVGGRTLVIMGSIKAGTNWLETGDGDTGTISLRNTNQLAWVTNTSGVLLVRHSGALGDDTCGTVITSGSALEVSTTVNVPEPVIIAGTGIANSGAIRNNGNNNVWSGPVTLNSASVRINSDQASLAFTGGISGAVDPSLLVGGAGSVIISNVPLNLGAGTLTKDGSGTLVLNATNVLGSCSVSAGRLVADAAEATGTGPVIVNSGAILSGAGVISGPVTLNAGSSIGGGSSTAAGILTVQNGADLSSGVTNLWKLAANGTTPGVDCDQVALPAGNLVLGGGSVLSIKFAGTATAPDLTNAFWQAPHQWTIFALSGSAANPSAVSFGAIDGTNGITAGTFSTSVDTTGNVILSYAPNIIIPPQPVVDTSIPGAGTADALISWSSVNGAVYRVLYADDLSGSPWSTLTNITATGAVTTIQDSTTPVPDRRFYRIVSP